MRRALLLVLLGSCTPAGDAPVDCYWIGSVNPLTGGLGPVGLPLENAAKLAVRDINEAGGVAGKSLCIATGDDRTNPDRAEAVTRALIERQDIRALNGAAASSSSLKALIPAKEYDMAIVSCCSTSPALTAEPLFYRTVPSDALQGVALANLAKGRLAAQSAAIIYINNTYGQALRDQFQTAFVGEGRTITRTVSYEERKSSYVDVVNAALTAPVPDHIVLIAYPVEGSQIIRDWKTSGLGRDVKWLATDGLKDDNFALTVGSLVPDLQGTAPVPNGKYYPGFVERYKAAYGGEFPGIFTSNQYDAVVLIALAMARAGASAERGRIRELIPDLSRKPGDEVNADNLGEALAKVSAGQDVDYQGVSGEVELDANGDVQAGYRVWSVAGSAIQETAVCFDCDRAAPPMLVSCVEGPCVQNN